MFPALIQRRPGLALLLLLAVSLVIPQWLSAQPPAQSVDTEPPALGDPSTLSEYLEFAAWNHPGLKAAFQRFQASFETIEQVQTLPDPKLSYAYFLETVETRVGPQRQKIGVSQALPWLSKLRLRGDLASEVTHAAKQRYEAVKVKLFFEVKDAYYELYYLGRAIAITEDNISLLKYLESVAQAEFKGGAPMSGVIKAQLELGKLDDRLRSLQALREPTVARLNAALGRRADAPVPWPRQAPIRQLEITDSAVLGEMAAHNPELRRLDFEIARDEYAVELARKDFRPDFAVGLDWVDTGDALAQGVPDSGKDPLVAMVSVSLPIWRSKLRAGVREAERRREASRNSRDNLENTLDSKLAMTLFRLRDAERKIDLYRDTLVPLAEASLAVTQEGYEAGKGDFLDVIDAQRLLLELQLSFERSVADHEQRIAELEMLVGRPLPAAPPQDPQATSGAHR